MVSKGVKAIDHVDRLLTLEGLSLIYEKNKKQFWKPQQYEQRKYSAACGRIGGRAG